MHWSTSFLLYRRLLQQARPYWPHLVGLLVLSLLSPPLALLTPLPLKIALDNIIGNEPLPKALAAWLPASLQHGHGGLLVFAVALVVAVGAARAPGALPMPSRQNPVGESARAERRQRVARTGRRAARVQLVGLKSPRRTASWTGFGA
jgi:ATP-binding cassette subfamily B protein